jgi:hypothetical protein
VVHLRSILRPLGIVLLAPLIVPVAVAILIALIGIFIAWLMVMGFLAVAVVIPDLRRRAMRRTARSPAVADRPAVDMPAR